MAFLRPNLDDADGNWLNQSGSNASLFASIDEDAASLNDGDYIQSPANPIAETCRVALSDPTGSIAEPFIVRYRFNNLGGSHLIVRLLQGTTEIAAWTETTAGWTTQARTLTTPQFSAITDFTNLFLEFTATVGSSIRDGAGAPILDETGQAILDGTEPLNILMVGHSLVNHNSPWILEAISPEGTVVERQVINGSPLSYNWNNAATAEGVNGRTYLEASNTDVLIFTEAGPIDHHIYWSDTHGYSKLWSDLAKAEKPGALTYFYQTWQETDDDPDSVEPVNLPGWRSRITSWWGVHPDIVAFAELDGISPVGHAFGLIYDDLLAETAPAGAPTIEELLPDGIHCSQIGLHVCAYVHYATVFNASPVGLPYITVDRDGYGWNTTLLGDGPANADVVEWIQEKAWQAVQNPPSHDIVPSAFSFTPVSSAGLSALQTSNIITLAGFIGAAVARITNGVMQLNGSGSYQATPFVVYSSDTLRVQHTSSASNGTAVTTTVSVNGVLGTFTSTTVT